MANGNDLPKLPGLDEVADVIGDAVMQIPAFPARLVQNVGGAISAAGAQANGAVGRVTGAPGIPGPGVVVGAAVDYVGAVPTLVIGGVDGVVQAVRQSVDGVVGSARRLGR